VPLVFRVLVFGFCGLDYELLASWRFYACFPVETGENFC